jgi:tyrosine-protein kinase Etk/Wzc
MQEKKPTNNVTQQEISSIGHSVIEFITTLVKYRKFLISFVLIISISATAYALLSPKWYKATTSVLPADQSGLLGSLGGISSLVKNFTPSRGIAALTGPSELDRYIAILKSGTMINDVISKFKIREDYELEDTYYENVVKAFLSNLEIDVQDEGNLTVSIYDKDPQKAADIANYMVNRLNDINTELSAKNAKANREFVEKRYLDNIEEINKLESEMQIFQEKFGVVAVPEQLEATVKTMAELYSGLAQKEVALNVIRRNFGDQSPLLRQIELEVEELQSKINSMIAGNSAVSDGINLLIPLKKAPKLSNRYLKIFRDLEIQYKILEFIQPLYEQARVEEIRNTPSVLVLDYAGLPERKSRPRGSIYLMVSFLLSSFFGLVIIFSIEGFKKIQTISPENYEYIRSALLFKSGSKSK